MQSPTGRERTSCRIHKQILGHLSDGGSNEFAITSSVRWGKDEQLDLRLKSARRPAENAAVLLEQSHPRIHTLNIDAKLGDDEETKLGTMID